jgi:hypothetical protein
MHVQSYAFAACELPPRARLTRVNLFRLRGRCLSRLPTHGRAKQGMLAERDVGRIVVTAPILNSALHEELRGRAGNADEPTIFPSAPGA